MLAFDMLPDAGVLNGEAPMAIEQSEEPPPVDGAELAFAGCVPDQMSRNPLATSVEIEDRRAFCACVLHCEFGVKKNDVGAVVLVAVRGVVVARRGAETADALPWPAMYEWVAATATGIVNRAARAKVARCRRNERKSECIVRGVEWERGALA